MITQRLFRWIFPVLAVTLLCSCRVELHAHLSERDANQMLSALYTAGIEAVKRTRDEKTWSVDVDEKDLQRALYVVNEQGLPRESFANTGELFKKEGLISTPSEERIRYIYAVSQELSNTLSQIDGVVSARVHPVIPANDPLASHAKPSSASVFIKHRRDADLSALAPAIRNLVMRGIEGLSYENISLTFVAADETDTDSTLLRAAMPERGSQSALAWGLLGALVVALGAFFWMWNRYRVTIGDDSLVAWVRQSRVVLWVKALIPRRFESRP